MKEKKFKGTVLLGIEADSLDEAQELTSDANFLKSLIDTTEVEITEIKCSGVEETEPGFYDLTCTISGKTTEEVDLKKLGICE